MGRVVLVLLAAPVLLAGLVVSLMVLGSHPPSARECAPQGFVAAVVPGGVGVWTAPLGRSYTVTAEYGWRTHPVRGGRDLHTGIDLASGGAAPVLAASAGRVVDVTDLGNVSYGRYLTVAHEGGVSTRYAHLASVSVRAGDMVVAGQQLGIEGASGGVTGPHLHFEVLVGGTAVEPREALRARGVELNGRPGSVAVDRSGTAALVPASVQGVDRSADLSAAQQEVARQIVSAGRAAGLPSRAWLVALMTALQESDLHADPATRVPNADGDVGAFQQRALPGWYADGASVAENVTLLNDVRYAASRFYLGHDVAVSAPGAAGAVGYHIPGLVDVAGWESMPLWQAAATVQRPAKEYETRYARHEATARGILAQVGAGAPDASTWQAAAACDRVGIARAVGSAVAPGSGDVVGDGPGAVAAAAALAQLGVPYSWGGGTLKGPSTGICCSPGGQNGKVVTGFDCSGLTRYAWAQAGVRLPRTSDQQLAATRRVDPGEVQAGDLYFFPGHVGIADGKGGMIHAPRPGKPVTVTPDVLRDRFYGPQLIGIGRPVSQGA